MKILITGINGLIGGILNGGLSGNFDIYGIDKDSSGKKVFSCDIGNFQELKNIFEKLPKIDCIVHLAADYRPEAPWESILKNNIMGTHNIYECARIFKIPKIIFASSNRVTQMYEGEPPVLHLEDTPRVISVSDSIRPGNDYGASKVYGEAIARQYHDAYGISSLCIRIGSLLKDNNPRGNLRWLKTWFSHRDLIQLFKKTLISDVPFAIYYGVSGNRGKFWDISNAQKDLGYEPEDDASTLP